MADGSHAIGKTDPTWQDWRRRVFGDPYLVWHDGPNFGRILQEYDEDAARVDRMLVAGITERDALAAESVGRLEPDKGVPLALAALVADHVSPSEEYALRRAQTLFELNGDSAHRDTMIAILNGADHWGVRIKAALALGDLTPTIGAIDALQLGVANVDYLVRYHSANALLRYAGEEPEIADHELFDAIASPRDDTRVRDSHRTNWAAAADQLATSARTALEDDAAADS